MLSFLKRNWMKIALTVSLALNLLIVGAVATTIYNAKRHYGDLARVSPLGRPAAMHRAARHLMWKLPRERRRELAELARKNRAALLPDMERLAKARLALANLIARGTVDQAEYQAALDAVSKAENDIHVQAGTLTRKFIDALTPEERRLYAEILKSGPRHHRKWKWGKRRHGAE